MMRIRLLVTSLALCASTSLLAQPRPSSLDMTCAEAQAYVLARGAAVLGTGGSTFDRFVRDRSFCQATEITETQFVPTRSNASCAVGFRCIERSQGDNKGDG